MSALLIKANKAALVLSQALAGLGLIALLVLATMTMVDGALRWLVNRPIEGVRDVGSLAIAFAVSGCMPIALIEKAHISVHLFESAVGGRFKQILTLFASCAVAVVSSLLAWEFWLYAGKLARGHETTVVLRIPTAPFWYAVDIVLWCAFAVQLVVTMNDLAQMFDGEPL